MKHSTFNLFGILLIVTIIVSSVTLFYIRHATVFGLAGPHLSNFALSLLIVFVLGVGAIAAGGRIRAVVAIVAVLITANIVVETAIGTMNTRDLTDALYGIIGVIAACGLLFVFYHYGVRSPRD